LTGSQTCAKAFMRNLMENQASRATCSIPGCASHAIVCKTMLDILERRNIHLWNLRSCSRSPQSWRSAFFWESLDARNLTIKPPRMASRRIRRPRQAKIRAIPPTPTLRLFPIRRRKPRRLQPLLPLEATRRASHRRRDAIESMRRAATRIKAHPARDTAIKATAIRTTVRQPIRPLWIRMRLSLRHRCRNINNLRFRRPDIFGPLGTGITDPKAIIGCPEPGRHLPMMVLSGPPAIGAIVKGDLPSSMDTGDAMSASMEASTTDLATWDAATRAATGTEMILITTAQSTTSAMYTSPMFTIAPS